MTGRREVQAVQDSFAGGLNTTADESQLKRNEMRKARNARLEDHGGITKRLGTQRIHEQSLAVAEDLTAGIAAGFTWRKTNPRTHLVACDGHLYHAAHGGYPLSFNDMGSGLDPNTVPDFESFRDGSADAVYIADGGQLHKYKEAGLTLNLPSTPNVSRLAVHNLRLWGAGDPDAPETLYHSALSNGDTLGDAAAQGGSTIIRTFAHEPITALLPVGQSLLIIHHRGVSRFTGWSQDDFNVSAGTRGVTQDVGTIAPDSVVAVENVGFLLSDRGAYAVTESGVEQISAKIENTLAAVPASDLVRVAAVHHRRQREVWFAIPNLGIMVYDYRLRAWTGPFIDTYLAHSPLSCWEAGPELYVGGADGYVRQADVGFKDDVLPNGTEGLPYTMDVQCHRMFFGDKASEKSLRYLYVTSNLKASRGAGIQWNTGQMVASHSLQPAGTEAIWGEATWGAATWGTSGTNTDRVHAHGRGNHLDLTLLDDGITEPVFSRVEAHAYEMGRRY